MIRSGMDASMWLPLFVFASMLFNPSAQGAGLELLENRIFQRSTGKPVTEVVSFSARSGEQVQFTLWNGGRENQYCRISSADIRLNNISLFRPSDFNQGVSVLVKSATLRAQNTISVSLASKPGCAVEFNAGRANQAPVIVSTPEDKVWVPNTFVYQARALNVVDEKVTFSLEEGPSALSITEEGYLSWTVTPADIGQHSVTIKATDVQGAFDTQSFLIYVLAPINQPPKFSSLPSQLVLQPGNVWQYPATAIDPENEPLVFSIDEAPEGFQVNAQTGFFYWLPVPEQAGQHRIIIRVQDPHGEMDTQQFSLAVNLGEEFWPPVIVSKPVQQTFVGATYRYPVIATDPDSPNLAFELLESVPGMSISQDSGEVLWTVPTDQLTGTIRITIKVSDERGQSDQQQYLLQVFRPNRAPSFVSLPPHVVTEQTRFRYDAKAVDPDVGDVLQYGFSLLNTNASINPETGVFHWQPDNRLAETVSLAHEYCMSDAPAEGVLDPVQKWRWQGVDGNSANADVFGPPMIAQLTDDNGDQVIDQRDTPDLVFIERRTNWLTAIDGATGKQHWVSKTIKLNGLGSVAVADIDGDGKVEIVATNESRNALHAFDHQGVLKWTAATGPTKTSPRDGISIADLDGDGQPEILHGARVFSHQGQLLWSGHQDSGGLESYGVLSIAADIDLDGKQEVIAGRTVYRHDGQV